jgi:hypothetical protein
MPKEDQVYRLNLLNIEKKINWTFVYRLDIQYMLLKKENEWLCFVVKTKFTW